MKHGLRRYCFLATIPVMALCASSIARADSRAHRHGHIHHKHGNVDRNARGPDAHPVGNVASSADGRGPFAGAGGIFSPNYEVPDAGVAHLGGQILGGDFGKAYENYYRHYYYYKYAACPVGSTYVIYMQRCFSPLDIFR